MKQQLNLKLAAERFSRGDLDLIARATVLATQAHRGQRRLSGQPYVSHPVAVAQSLLDWGMDTETVAAALLHDTLEDTDVELAQIKAQFGDKVAELVDGVTNLGKVDYQPASESNPRQVTSTENLRKLLLAMTKDLRVIVIKLADRRHNLLTLDHLDPPDQVRIAQESLEVFAPIADRLGMGQLKAEIEDLSFAYALPDEYQHVKSLVAKQLRPANRYIAKMNRFIIESLEKSQVKVVAIEGRPKHLYSVYKKLAKVDGDISKIYDLVAIRIIVPEEADCYRTLGDLHQHFKPLIYRIKDYIAVPKPNGYRSLHTTVFGLDGRITEIQIRTPKMHDEAERGLAAHFYYDATKANKNYRRGLVSAVPSKLNWVNKLTDLTAASSGELVEALKLDLFRDRIFIFSPKGDLYDLPEGATPIDFAFTIHSDIGLRAQGAKVNGRLVPLDSHLANRDVVEILTRKAPAPSRDWLGFVKTPVARNRIRAWFRTVGRANNIESGRQLLEQELKAWRYRRLDEVPQSRLNEAMGALKFNDLEALLASVGEGTTPARSVTKRLFGAPSSPRFQPIAKSSSGRVVVANNQDLPYALAACCTPSFPGAIVGFITRGSGVTVHSRSCPNLRLLEPDRLVDCLWDSSSAQTKPTTCQLEIVSTDRLGLLRDLTAAVAGMGLQIKGLKSRDFGGGEEIIVELGVEVPDIYVLANLIKKLERLPGVKKAQRVG